jgi:hypothetical protein
VSAWGGDWLVPEWPAPPGVRACVTARQGGVRRAPFDSFNLGDHFGDEPAAVAWYRQHLQEVLGCQSTSTFPSTSPLVPVQTGKCTHHCLGLGAGRGLGTGLGVGGCLRRRARHGRMHSTMAMRTVTATEPRM